MNNKVTRREFLKLGGLGVLGSVVLYTLGTSLDRKIVNANSDSAGAAPDKSAFPNTEKQQQSWGFICDTEKCIGCGKCVVACKKENKVPWDPQHNRTWVERYIISESGQTYVDSPNGGRDGFTADYMNAAYKNITIQKSFFVPKLCNQCAKPPCVTVCPVGATYQTPDGVVLIDQNHCIGCRYCIQACPYGARYVLPDTPDTIFGQVKVVDKCTWCYHRISKGLLPACVEVCPVGARKFGDMNDSESEVRKILREERVYVLKPTLGTEPQVSYVGIEKGII